MGLKNYTVRIKNVKKGKLNKLLNYLNDNNHKNHSKKNTVIVSRFDRDRFEQRENYKVEQNEQSYIKNKKGGRKLSVSNKSLTFNIPPDYLKNIETDENIDKIYRDIESELISDIIQLYKTYNTEISVEDLYSVLHNQDNPHYHIIIPYLDTNGNTLRFTKPAAFTTQLKLIFTKIVDRHLKQSINNYKLPSKEETEHNRVVRELNDLKGVLSNYMRYQVGDKSRNFFKNQIIQIDRVLKDSDNIFSEQNIKRLGQIQKGIDKINKINTEYQIKNITTMRKM